MAVNQCSAVAVAVAVAVAITVSLGRWVVWVGGGEGGEGGRRGQNRERQTDGRTDRQTERGEERREVWWVWIDGWVCVWCVWSIHPDSPTVFATVATRRPTIMLDSSPLDSS